MVGRRIGVMVAVGLDASLPRRGKAEGFGLGHDGA